MREINLKNEVIDFAEMCWLDFGFPKPCLNQDKGRVNIIHNNLHKVYFLPIWNICMYH